MLKTEDLLRVQDPEHWHRCQTQSIIHAGLVTVHEYDDLDGSPCYCIEETVSNGRPLFVPGVFVPEQGFSSLVSTSKSGRVMVRSAESLIGALNICVDHLFSRKDIEIDDIADRRVAV